MESTFEKTMSVTTTMKLSFTTSANNQLLKQKEGDS